MVGNHFFGNPIKLTEIIVVHVVVFLKHVTETYILVLTGILYLIVLIGYF